MMRSASRQALERAARAQDSAVSGGRASADTLATIAEELYAVAGLLVDQPRLRRALGDPATQRRGPRRAGRAAARGQGRRAGARPSSRPRSRERWSSPWDLTDALEGAGDDALFAAAEKDGKLDRVEDELFRLERILRGEGEIAALLDERTVDRRAAHRAARLAASRARSRRSPSRCCTTPWPASASAASLLAHRRPARAAAGPAASVRWPGSCRPSPLTDEQEQRLAAALTEMYGRAISVRTALDPTLRGGLVVRVGDEVIDGSIATPLRRRPARRWPAEPHHLTRDTRQTRSTEKKDTFMAELTISADEIRSAIESYVSSYTPEASREEVGVVAETGDGIARVEGLPSAMTNELLEFEGGTLGIALNLDVREIGVVILGDVRRHRGGPAGQAHRRDPLGPGRRRLPRPRGRPARPADRRPGRDRDRRSAARSSCRRRPWCSARR